MRPFLATTVPFGAVPTQGAACSGDADRFDWRLLSQFGSISEIQRTSDRKAPQTAMSRSVPRTLLPSSRSMCSCRRNALAMLVTTGQSQYRSLDTAQFSLMSQKGHFARAVSNNGQFCELFVLCDSPEHACRINDNEIPHAPWPVRRRFCLQAVFFD
jgi:hypothetical protein